uniref:Uncharacterized protein n=1 Tax=Physcomitrium patens TaxID=3218 RepID=A0A2K1JS24_PHYPA|nr:hypothetical protein PHYPA_016650 [Physcomitrium patens]
MFAVIHFGRLRIFKASVIRQFEQAPKGHDLLAQTGWWHFRSGARRFYGRLARCDSRC